MYSDRYLKLPNKVAAVILLSKCSEGTKRNQEGHDMTCKQYIREGSMFVFYKADIYLNSVFVENQYRIFNPPSYDKTFVKFIVSK